MLYLDYERYRLKYYEAQRKYNDIIEEKEILFAQTQPQAIQYDAEKTSGGKMSNTFDEYLIAKERKRIDERLSEAQSILEDRQRLMKLKEKELRESKNYIDRIYVMRHIDKIRVYKIASAVNYSEAQVYRALQEIKKNCSFLYVDRK